MKNKSIIVFIAVSIMLILSSCKSSKKEIISLITKSESSEEIEYVSIYSNGKAKKETHLLQMIFSAIGQILDPFHHI